MVAPQEGQKSSEETGYFYMLLFGVIFELKLWHTRIDTIGALIKLI